MAATDTITFTYTLDNGTSGTQSFIGNDNCQQLKTYIGSIGEYRLKSATLSGNGSGSANKLFYNTYWLTSLDVSNFDTSNVTDMSYMFSICEYLTSLDVSNFDTSNVTDMSYMFGYCPLLTSLDVSNFDTSNVTDMSFMFTFCQNLTSLDVSNFDTSNVTDMSYMFDGCGFLTTIYCNDDWNKSTVEDSSSMFSYCRSLVGAIPYDSSKVDVDYANPTTGYFTRTQTTKPVYFNGTQLEHVNFNGTEIEHLIFNETQVY